MASLGSLKSAIFEREERKQQYQAHIRGLNAYDRHKKFVKDYVDFYGKARDPNNVLPIKTDQDTLREGYRFIRSEEDDMNPSWEQRLVKRYYGKLFKEYCIADMSRYKSGKIGLRWRTEKEVISGKGQFVCGNKHCDGRDGLASYELYRYFQIKKKIKQAHDIIPKSPACFLKTNIRIIPNYNLVKVNFCYFEAGENKQALVKLVACKRCAEKLVYKKLKEKEKLEEKEKHKRKRERNHSDSDDERSTSYWKKKGQRASTMADSGKTDLDDNFEEFLEGMFP